MWDAFPALREGFRRILADEGRHITFGTAACRILIEKHPAYEAHVHEVFDEYRGNLVGLVEYQKAVPGLDMQKYQTMKVRHYRNRCREMGITPDETLIDQILDPDDRLRGRRGGRLTWPARGAASRPDCDEVVTAADDERLVAAVNRHVSEDHHSFELEDVILDAAEDV